MAPVRIAIVPNETTAEIVCGRLRTEGIDCSYRRTDLAVGASDGALSGAGPIEVGATLKKYEDQGIGVNAGLLVGHGTIRRSVVGRGELQATADQLDKMKSLVKKAIEEATKTDAD